MKALSAITLVSVSLQAVLALPQADLSPRQTCSSPKVRKEWSKATQAEQSSYIKAALCLATKPSKIGLKTTLYDDFGYIHALLFGQIHDQPSFFPWHRYFLDVYEKALHDCGYSGTIMYWDWVADSAAPAKAKVFDTMHGFGTNGTNTRDHCLVDGPFKDLRPAYWNGEPRNEFNPPCLARAWEPGYPEFGVIEMYGEAYSPPVLERINAIEDFDEFRRDLESGPHAAIHGGVGGRDGDMGLQSSSPNDPLFFLHHAQVDRLWWRWQQQDAPRRTFMYYGPKQDGVGTPATLDDILPMAKLAADLKVHEFMDTKGGPLCYTYDS